MSDIKTPDAIIRDLEAVRNHAAQGPAELRKAEGEYLEAKRQHDREYALAYKRAAGPVEDRKQQATIDADSFAQAMDDAQIVLNYVKAQSRSLDSQQSNLQTQARLVEITYRLAGVGQP
jgi:multidrug resistance efflux pump